MIKNDIRVDEEMAAAITAAVSAYMGHGDFAVRSIKPSAHERKNSPVSKESRFVCLKTNN